MEVRQVGQLRCEREERDTPPFCFRPQSTSSLYDGTPVLRGEGRRVRVEHREPRGPRDASVLRPHSPINPTPPVPFGPNPGALRPRTHGGWAPLL